MDAVKEFLWRVWQYIKMAVYAVYEFAKQKAHEFAVYMKWVEPEVVPETVKVE